jgi:hypothetical protein
MVTFFILLVVLMVRVVAAGTWASAPRRRVYYERPAEREVVELVDDGRTALRPLARRSVVRRRRTS